ncbi:MAG: hypothetical protein M1831_005582 [Alyxoria varia]|nr:MAG: hypothetical protein M1831_005582 [Alyxoria varia]
MKVSSLIALTTAGAGLLGLVCGDEFSSAKDTGKSLYEDLQNVLKDSNAKDKTGGDKKLEDYKERWSNGKDKLAPPVDLRDELNSLGAGIGNEYYQLELLSRNGDKVVFDNEWSVSQGVIIANDNDRGNDDRPTDDQLSLGEALFWEYDKLAKKDSEDIKKMKYHFRHSITNDLTQKIIDEVYKRLEKDRSKEALEIKPTSDEFFALLGTPNGRATAVMLKDHPVALGKKNINSCKILKGDRYNMYFAVDGSTADASAPNIPSGGESSTSDASAPNIPSGGESSTSGGSGPDTPAGGG